MLCLIQPRHVLAKMLALCQPQLNNGTSEESSKWQKLASQTLRLDSLPLPKLNLSNRKPQPKFRH